MNREASGYGDDPMVLTSDFAPKVNSKYPKVAIS